MIKNNKKGTSYYGLIVLGLVICFLAFSLLIYFGQRKIALSDIVGSFLSVDVETTTTTQKTTIPVIVKTTSSSADCLNTQFRLYSGTYDSSYKKLYLILENQKSVDLTLKNLYLFYPNDGLKEYSLTGILNGNSLRSFVVNGVDDGFTSGKIKTNCPDSDIDFSISQLTIKTSSLDKFAKCLTEKGATLYASKYCGHCQNQKEMFGDSLNYINQVECTENQELCQQMGIQGVPTWIIDGKSYVGVQSLETLSSVTGCPLE